MIFINFVYTIFSKSNLALNNKIMELCISIFSNSPFSRIYNNFVTSIRVLRHYHKCFLKNKIVNKAN